MIAYLRGTARTPKILDVDGVGYLVHCATPMTPGSPVELHVHTQVREDAITLYGFADEDEKSVFEALVKVTGVGPNSALLLLSGLGARAVAEAVRRRDTKTLSSVKGIGAKVAEKIITLVKLPDTVGEDPRTTEIVDALTALGFERVAAGDAARRAIETAGDNADEARIITDAIAIAQAGRGQNGAPR